MKLDKIIEANQSVIRFMKENEIPLTYENIEHLFINSIDEFA